MILQMMNTPRSTSTEDHEARRPRNIISPVIKTGSHKAHTRVGILLRICMKMGWVNARLWPSAAITETAKLKNGETIKKNPAMRMCFSL